MAKRTVYTTDQKTRRDFTSFTFHLSFLHSLVSRSPCPRWSSTEQFRCSRRYYINNDPASQIIGSNEEKKKKEKKKTEPRVSSRLSLARDCSAFPFTRPAQLACKRLNYIFIFRTHPPLLSKLYFRQYDLDSTRSGFNFFHQAGYVLSWDENEEIGNTEKTRRTCLKFLWMTSGVRFLGPLGRRPCENAFLRRKEKRKRNSQLRGLSWTNKRGYAASTHWNLPAPRLPRIEITRHRASTHRSLPARPAYYYVYRLFGQQRRFHCVHIQTDKRRGSCFMNLQISDLFK